MEKEFVAYEQALALKELGFDEPCFGFYIYNNKLLHLPKFIESWNGNKNKHISISHSAPLYQQAFRWFRKEYEVECFIKHFKPNDGYPNGYYCISNPNKYYSNSTSDWCFTNFKSYEEAELECLKKLILIFKNK